MIPKSSLYHGYHTTCGVYVNIIVKIPVLFAWDKQWRNALASAQIPTCISEINKFVRAVCPRRTWLIFSDFFFYDVPFGRNMVGQMDFGD
jgi:hypothetical protein